MAFDEFLFAGKELHFDLQMPVMPEEFMSSQQKPLAVHEGFAELQCEIIFLHINWQCVFYIRRVYLGYCWIDQGLDESYSFMSHQQKALAVHDGFAGFHVEANRTRLFILVPPGPHMNLRN